MRNVPLRAILSGVCGCMATWGDAVGNGASDCIAASKPLWEFVCGRIVRNYWFHAAGLFSLGVSSVGEDRTMGNCANGAWVVFASDGLLITEAS